MSRRIRPSFGPRRSSWRARASKPQAEIARELGMTDETLRLWLKQADLDEGKRSDGLTQRGAGGAAPAAAREPHPARGARDPKKSRGLLRAGDRLDPVVGYEFVEREKATPCRRHALPGAGCLPQRLLGLAQASAARRGRRLTRSWPSRFARFTRRAAGTYGVPRVHAELASAGTRAAGASASRA